MTQAPAAPAAQAPTSMPARTVPADMGNDGPGHSGGMDLLASIDKLRDQKSEVPVKKEVQKPKEQVKKDTPKVEAPKVEDKAKSADGWDVEAVSTDEPVESPQKPIEEAPEGMKPEAQTRWKDLRAKEVELGTIKPEYERLKTELETLKNTPAKRDEKEEAEIQELKKFKAAYDVEGSEEYQNSVMKPYNEHMGKIQEVADYAKVPMDKIAEAMKEKNTLARTRAIRDLLTANVDGVELSPEEIGIVTRAADALHSDVFPKDKALRDQAIEIQTSLKGDQEAKTSKQKEAHDQALNKASAELYEKLSTKLKPLGIFSNEEFTKSLQAARPADPAKEPMKAISQAYAELLVPALMTDRNKLATEVKELRAALKARGEAGAGTSDNSGGNRESSKTQDEEDGGRTLFGQLPGPRR